jgi:hypothetical protein
VLLIVSFLQLSFAITIECEFKDSYTFFDTFYACEVKRLSTTFDNRTITQANGIHEQGKSHSEVEMFFTSKQNCPYLPLNVGAIFPNLKIYFVRNSNVQHLMVGDLKGMKNLEIFDVSYNPIDQISTDFFVGFEHIKKISFYDCHLKKINRGSFDTLKNLEGLYFDLNPCVSMRSEDKLRMSVAVKILYDKCDGADHTDRQHSLSVLSDEKIEKSSEDKSSSTMYIILFSVSFAINLILVAAIYRILSRKFPNDWVGLREVIL